ncbi:MAG: carboxypeptidase-like regulatory domain-containing protein [Bacteroidetes bacterium]|jgi:hypothetical protein|nr:carboxypeptidase-like regulatory domain-containing protein [Bacteroidota bacterium]
MKTGITLLLALCLTTGLLAQAGVSGTVYSASGEPLPFASIFVKETGSGTTTNAQGKYEIRLGKGDYTLVFQYLGYETQSKQVTVGRQFEQLNVTLSEQALELQEVDVLSGREDPAYTVMRKAIAKASYHREQVETYTAEVYIKGTGRVKEVSWLFEDALEEAGVDSSTVFTTESVSEVSYQRPNTFKERVISVYTTGSDQGSVSPNAYINGSFYQPKIGEAISPLSPRAFAYYRFEFEGFFMDRGYGVNKIKVIPRSKGDGVFEGTLYIVEDLWSIYSLDLTSFNQGFSINVGQTFAPVQEEVWMPVTQTYDIAGSIMGFTIEFRYLATASDYQITLNPDLKAEFTVIDEKIETERAAEVEAREKPEGDTPEERLARGEEITRKDLRKLMRKYRKAERKEQAEPEVVENREYTVDSSAYKRDSLYWEKIRPVPLTPLEVKSYERRDSIAAAEAEEEDGEESDEVDLSGMGMMIGSKYDVSESVTFSHSSPFTMILFNPVEGFSLHSDLSLAVQPNDNRFAFTATPRYAFARKKFTGKGELSYTYGAQRNQHQTRLEGGRYIYQYNAENPISFGFSSYVNLFRDLNYIRLYEKDYLQLQHKQVLAPNWSVTLGGEWANRYRLDNNTTQVWFNEEGQQYASNYPVSRELGLSGLPDEERAFVLSAEIEAKPWQKYRIYNGERIEVDQTSPTLHLAYRQGLSGVEGSVTDYSYLEAGITHRFDVGAGSRLDMRVEGGLFLQDDYVGFADYRHFQGNELTLVTADPVASYRLLPYYGYSTRDRFASAFLHYQFRQLLVTQIPTVWMLGIKENVFANALTTPESGTYYELGYSIDNILRFLRVEVAFSFDDNGYREWGILVGIASSFSGALDGSGGSISIE